MRYDTMSHASQSTTLPGKKRSITKAISIALSGGLLALSSVAQAQSITTKMTYDADNNITSVTDPRGLVTTYARDGFGYLWQQVSPDTGTTQVSYDGYGRIANMTRADGTQTTYAYDSLNRQTSVIAGGQTQTYTYDNCTNGKGHLCSVGDAIGSTSYSYTPEGWMAGRGFSVSGTTYALGYNYDAMGRITVVSYPDGNDAIYYYTNGVVNGVRLVVGSNAWAISNVTYRPDNMAMASWTSTNGLVNTLSYDSDGRLTGIAAPGIQSLGFSYDNVNRITQITNGIDPSVTQDFGYDAQSRLASVYSGAENESYQYDADGNRITATINGVGQTYTYGTNNNQLTKFSGSLSATYGYDPLGNTTTINGASSYQFNPFNRLASSGGATNYVNPEGQRLRKTGGSSGSLLFAPDVSGDLMAENDNGTWVDYIRLNGRLVGRISGSTVDSIHADQIGRPEVVTDANKLVVWRAQNFPFTNNVTVSNRTLNLGLPGQYYDTETSTWNNGFRDFSSGFGRYLESDPTGLTGGINTYAYVENDPISNGDPYGLWAATVQAYGLFGALGGGVVISGTGFGIDSIGFRMGAGKGGGVSINPLGGKPDEDAKCPSNSVGVFAEAEIGKGPVSVGAGVNAGITMDQQLNFRTYGGWEPEYGLGSSEGAAKFVTFGIEYESDASAGIEFTHTFH